MSKFSSYNEELGVNAVEDTGIYASGDKLKKYIPNMEDEDIEKFVIVKSKLLYIGIDEIESKLAESLGLGSGSSDSSDAGATIKEIQKIVDNVVEVSEENRSKIPTSDEDKLDEKEHFNDKDGLIGLRLFDRSGQNLINGTWNILIEYDTQNSETARYGTGYYWLKEGETYTIGGEEIPFKNDYVINYEKGEYEVLSGRAVNWNVNATLGVPDEIVDGKHTLALNLDPISFGNGTWELSTDAKDVDEVNNENFYNFKVKNTNGNVIDTGIQKSGDVVYNNENKALEFNKSEENETGEGGYIRLSKDGLDFSSGFTFEIYCNLDRLLYKNTKNSTANIKGLGLFCKMASLLKTKYSNALRFGYTQEKTVCKFFGNSSWQGRGDNMATDLGGSVNVDDCGFMAGKDFYLTFVYRDYQSGISNSSYDSYMEENHVDKIEYYVDGKLFAFSFYGMDSYDKGIGVWGGAECPFFIGVCPWQNDGNLFYLKGLLYSTRLYTKSLTPEEVKLNYDMTLKYRDSFKNE